MESQDDIAAYDAADGQLPPKRRHRISERKKQAQEQLAAEVLQLSRSLGAKIKDHPELDAIAREGIKLGMGDQWHGGDGWPR
jgi:hypothetical protein